MTRMPGTLHHTGHPLYCVKVAVRRSIETMLVVTKGAGHVVLGLELHLAGVFVDDTQPRFRLLQLVNPDDT